MEDTEHCQRCPACDTGLYLGVNVLRAQEGVLGTKGFVPLADELLFCNEDCLRKHFDDSEITTFDRRIP